MVFQLARRQIHLDFHTSSLIPDVGKQFDAQQFAQMLADSDVNSVTCFARCHHGMIYYPSAKHPEAIHPNLKNRNLLGQQIEACHQVNIKAPVYITIQWDQRLSEAHPEWCMRSQSGQDVVASWSKPGYLEEGFYTFLCVNSPYRQFVLEEVEELLESYDIDGFFFDILYIKPCYCPNCIRLMLESHINLSDEREVKKFSAETLVRFKREVSEKIWSLKPDTTVYYNTSHVHPGYRRFSDYLSHIEVESLPSGGWGYDHFPVVGRYARTLGKPVLGMTGKFHTYWGDFHSLKNPEALQYECFLINALGASVSVGDQMHPDGRLSRAGYQLIHSVFNELKVLQPYCVNTIPVCEIAILNPEECQIDAGSDIFRSLRGATRMLQECGYQFDVIDSQHEFHPYKLIVLVDSYRLTEEVTVKLRDFLSGGGKVLASGASPFDDALSYNGLPELGVIPLSEIPYSPDYVLVSDHEIRATMQLPDEELVMYQGSVKIAVKENADILAYSVAPYFNRSGRYYCSHQHTPSSHQISHPALVATSQCSYFAHPIFTIYSQKAPRWNRNMIKHQCDRLLEQPLIQHNGPASLIVTVNHQPDEKRYIVHLLHYVPESRCSDLLIVDAIMPLNKLQLFIALPNITSVRTVRDTGTIVLASLNNDGVAITLDTLRGYQLIVLDYRMKNSVSDGPSD